jgi:hypothetical protein
MFLLIAVTLYLIITHFLFKNYVVFRVAFYLKINNMILKR